MVIRVVLVMALSTRVKEGGRAVFDPLVVVVKVKTWLLSG